MLLPLLVLLKIDGLGRGFCSCYARGACQGFIVLTRTFKVPSAGASSAGLQGAVWPLSEAGVSWGAGSRHTGAPSEVLGTHKNMTTKVQGIESCCCSPPHKRDHSHRLVILASCSRGYVPHTCLFVCCLYTCLIVAAMPSVCTINVCWSAVVSNSVCHKFDSN